MSSLLFVCNRIIGFCLEHFSCKLFVALVLIVFGTTFEVQGQTAARRIKADLPAQDEIQMKGVINESDGSIRHLRGNAEVETSEMIISADEIDYDSDTAWANARGHVHLEHFATGDKINADHAEYNLQTEEGKFYVVDGTSPAKIMTSPGVLTTTNPFYFKAVWAERIRDRYILHHGFLTDCKIPKPWWIFQAPVFDIVPGDRAIARHTLFRVKRVPVFYLPYFYRPLGKNPRQSGFLTPNFGHSTFYGYMYGGGYYWAVNRSYDMTGVVQYFTQRGPAVTYNFRGKPTTTTDFNFRYYSVFDRGLVQQDGSKIKEGGREFSLTARTQFWGFTGRLDYNYLSSYLFREAFSYSFATAIFNRIGSVGYLQRRFDSDAYTLSIALQRDQTYQAITYINQRPNQVVIQKLPSIEFSSRDQPVVGGKLPVWFSFGSSVAVLDREEPTGANTELGGPPAQVFRSGPVGRVDIEPHVNTAFSFKGFSLMPGINFAVTDYTSQYTQNTTTYNLNGCGATCPSTTVNTATANLLRKNADFTLDLRLPTVERVYTPPKWLHLGTKVKHVIEGQATYEYVTGVDEFQKIIHFDETDIVSNTNQLTISLTNRLYKKDKDGKVSEFITWKLAQARFFDPTFGGAVLPGARNIVLASQDFSPYPFLDGPRTYSPIVSSVIVNPYAFLAVEWRAEYDPLRKKIIDQTVGTSIRYSKYFVGMSETAISTNPLLVPQANQINYGGGYGNSNGKGWNGAINVLYDLYLGRTVFETITGAYNTDCCGFSMQLRRINFGIRDENQYLFSFSVANIGTFGSLQKQARGF
jgi:LPS-assembly protein